MKKRDYKNKLNQKKVAAHREFISNIQMQGFWKGGHFIIDKILVSSDENYKDIIKLLDSARIQLQKDKNSFKGEEFYNKFLSLLDIASEKPENK